MKTKLDILTTAFIDLRSRLHHIALRMLLNDADADDALQDTYLKLRSATKVESSAEARYKLVAVLRNVCIDRLRRRRTVAIESAGEKACGVVLPEDESIDRLEKLLQSGLTPLQMQIFEMITHQGLDYDAISTQLGMSIEAVRTNMCRTRKKILENYKLLYR